MNTLILCFIFLILLSSAFAAIFQHAVHRREGLMTKLIKEGRWKEYTAYKQRLHEKLSNLKSTSSTEGYDNGSYYVNITIGTPEQFFTAVLDITRGDTFIPDVTCDSCYPARTFNSSKSSTYKPTNYSHDHYPSGVYGQDYFRFGSPGTDQLVISNAMFVQSFSVPGVYQDRSYIGLGFTTDHPDIDPLIITAIKSGTLDSPVVTLFMKFVISYSQSDNAGVITYGAVDTVNCDRNVIYEPLTDPNNFQVSINKASLRLAEFSGNWTAYIDTKLSFVAPIAVASAFFRQVNYTCYSNRERCRVDCNIKLNLDLTIGSTVYTLTENELISHYGNDACFFEIIPSFDNTWSLGSVWLSGFCTILDYGNKRVGFAKVITPNATSPGVTTPGVTTLGVTTPSVTTSDTITSGVTTSDGNHSSSIYSLDFILLGILLVFIQ